MAAIKLEAFAGMVPALDPRLLADNACEDAENVWFYNGTLEGIRRPRLLDVTLDPTTRSVFRVPIDSPDIKAIDDSYWLEFPSVDVSVVKSPVSNSADPAYYWASPLEQPGYTTRSRLAAGRPALVLGIPVPGVAPSVIPNGGVGATVTRAYVYTWVSSFGEEGAPSPATVRTGKVDDTWRIIVTPPTVLERANRVLEHTRIYRTVTSSIGVASYYFVAELPINTGLYNDTLSDDEVINAGLLTSTDFTPPPEGLVGMTALPNGMLCGWVGNEIWFSEPYRPHAWPAKYQISTEYDIVAMVGAAQSLIIGTEGYPYVATGVSPPSMTLARIASAEPCQARNSMVGSPYGAYYASPNGLIFVTPTGAVQNLTRATVSKQVWQEILELHLLRAALLNGAYVVYNGISEQAFQEDAFQTDAFQQFDDTNARKGALVEFQDARVGFSRLFAPHVIYNVSQDIWTGEVLLVMDNGVSVLDLTYPDMSEYSWLSKIFSLPKPDNLGAIKITYDAPLGAAPVAGTVTVYAGGTSRMVRAIPASDQVFRLPSGFKANNYQLAVTGNLVIKSIQVGASVKDLQQV